MDSGFLGLVSLVQVRWDDSEAASAGFAPGAGWPQSRRVVLVEVRLASPPRLARCQAKSQAGFLAWEWGWLRKGFRWETGDQEEPSRASQESVPGVFSVEAGSWDPGSCSGWLRGSNPGRGSLALGWVAVWISLSFKIETRV